MPRSEGTGFTSGAGGYHSHEPRFPLPLQPVAHRLVEREPFVSPIVLREPASVAQIAAPAPARPRRGAPSVAPELVAEIVRLYRDERLSIQEVATKVELSFTTVKKYLHESPDVELRPRGGGRRQPSAPKQCAWCGATFDRRETERARSWKVRETCSKPCAGRLAATRGRRAS